MRPVGLGVVAAVLLSAGWFVAGQVTATGQEIEIPTITLASGHADVGPRVVDGALSLEVREDVDGESVWRTIEEVAFKIDDEGALTVPAGEQFSFLGAAGATVWIFPQVQSPEVLWPGWNSQDPSLLEAAVGQVEWTLRSVDGEGDFFLFLSGSFGNPELLFESTLSLPQSITFDLDTHAHGNWVFTRPGVYAIEMEMSVESAVGERLTDSGSLTVIVGDVDVQAPTPTAILNPTATSVATEISGEPTPSPAPDNTPEADSEDDTTPGGNAGLIAAALAGGALIASIIAFTLIRGRRSRENIVP